jgi:hypothetical protein
MRYFTPFVCKQSLATNEDFVCNAPMDASARKEK